MYISLRYLFLSVMLATQLVNANSANPKVMDDAPINKGDIEKVLKEQDMHFAYMPKGVQRILCHMKKELKVDDHHINQVIENHIGKKSNVLPYELALEVTKECGKHADKLNDEQKEELEKYRKALINKDAHIRVEMDKDATTRSRGKAYCCLLAQCLKANNANICGVADIGRLNISRAIELPDGTLLTGTGDIVLGVEALRFIRGVVDPGFLLGGSPTIISGAGFTVAPAAGVPTGLTGVTVTYNKPYPVGDVPAVVVSATGTAGLVASPLIITSNSNTGFTVAIDTGVITGLSNIDFHVAGAR